MIVVVIMVTPGLVAIAMHESCLVRATIVIILEFLVLVLVVQAIVPALFVIFVVLKSALIPAIAIMVVAVLGKRSG